jgi:hypothetical protein
VGQVEEETYTSPESDLDSVIDSLMTADKSYEEEEPETDPIYE